MPGPLSNDLRRRIVSAYFDGEGTLDEVAGRFQVGSATVVRLVRMHRQNGSVAPKPRAGGPAPIVRPEDVPLLERWLAENPSLTQTELAERYEEHTGRPVSQRTSRRTLERAGITRKKSRNTPPSGTDRT